MKNNKYTQKRISIRNRRKGIHLNNNMLNKKEIIKLINNKKPIVHNNYLNKGWEIGVIANRNKRLTQEQINAVKQDLKNPKYFNLKLSKYFDIYFKLTPNKVLTQKGILVRMGKGKGKIRTKAIYLLKNRVYIELKLKQVLSNISLSQSYMHILFSKFLRKYTFFSIRTSLL